uniref:Uncharacterized protein n=1 Tax=Calidris pygmaea TaxID=425635 RepID=A0A8C3JCA4_9CHAR
LTAPSQRFDKFLHENSRMMSMLEKNESKTGVNWAYITSVTAPTSIIGVIVVYLVIGYRASFLCNIIGFGYPACIS